MGVGVRMGMGLEAGVDVEMRVDVGVGVGMAVVSMGAWKYGPGWNRNSRLGLAECVTACPIMKPDVPEYAATHKHKC